MAKNLYDILGVSQNASEDEIKKAYKKMSVKYHPDRNPDDKDAEEKFKEVQAAGEILRDPEKRAKYDKYGDNWEQMSQQPDMGGFANMSDFIKRAMGGMGGFNFGFDFDNEQSDEAEDINIEVRVTLEQIFNGGVIEERIAINERCKTCNGNGGDADICPYCKGKGGERTVSDGPFGRTISTRICPHCGGAGKHIKSKCHSCNGSGFDRVYKPLKINIPKGVRHGQTIQYKGAGHEARNAENANGNINIQFFYTFDESKYQIHGFSVYEIIEIPYYDCIVGCTRKVTLPNKKELTINIPKNSKTGTKVSLKGESFNNGDYIFVVKSTMPETVSEKEYELLQEIQKLH